MVASLTVSWTLQNVVWLLGFVLELAIAVAIVRRRAHQEYPFFFSYMIMELTRTVVLAGIGRLSPSYFYAYWISECLVAMFGFLVVEEVFRKAFERRLGLQKFGAAVYRYSLLLLIVTAVLITVFVPGNESNKLIAGILTLKRTQSFVRVGLVGCLFAFVFLLGLPWGNYSVGIALGFALYGAVELAVMVGRSHYGPSFYPIWAWSILCAGASQRLVWAAYFMVSRPLQSPALARKQDYAAPIIATEMSTMNEAIESFLSR